MKRRVAIAAPIGALVIALALAPGALAGRGGGGHGGGGGTTSGGGTISLVLLNSTDGLPHVMQQVTFKVSTTATPYPWVTVDCYGDGVWLYHASKGIFPTSLGQNFTLGSNIWLSGPADCTAWLQNWDSYSKRGVITNLASTSFHVYA